MKNSLIVLFIALCSFSVFSAPLHYEVSWTMDFQKKVSLVCDDESETTCEALCENMRRCEVLEKTCTNCIGNDLFITNFYKNIGESIVYSGREFDESTVYTPFVDDQFITLTANSIYNIITEFDSRSMRARFAKLCPFKTKTDPVVFIKVDEDRYPLYFYYVACDDRFFEITGTPDLYEQIKPALY